MFFKKIEMVIKVEGMSCKHCAKKVVMALNDIQGVKKVEVNLDSKQVKIISKEELEEQIIKKKIEDLGYTYIGVIK